MKSGYKFLIYFLVIFLLNCEDDDKLDSTVEVYKVSFDRQDGTEVETYLAKEKMKIPRFSATRAGYIFVGWYKDSLGTKAFDFETEIIIAAITLYAKWKANSYTITFDSQDTTTVKQIKAKYGDTITAPTLATKTDSALVGWYKDTLGTDAFNFGTETITSDITLYAKWIKTYTVTFDSQGGSKVDSLTVKNGDTIKVPTAPPTRAGYTFDGWYKDALGTDVFDFGTDTITADITLYAKWIKTHTVNFDSQGGSKVDSLTVKNGDTIKVPAPAATKTGYVFDGWFKDLADTTVFNFAGKIISDTTLYAKWKIKTYTVTFDSQGGSTVTSVSAKYGDTIKVPTAPTKTGHTFDGWYKDTSGTTAFDFAGKIIADTTLYAKWNRKTYTVTFDSQGGSTVVSVSAKYGDTIKVPTAPTKTGHTFDGWFKEATGTNVFNFGTDTITAAITLYAKWKVKTYTVTFDSQGGSKVDSLTVKNGDTIKIPTAPTRIGHIFVGWYKDSLGTNVFNFGTDTITAAITLYANWKRKTYTVTFDSQGGSKIDSLIVNYGKKMLAPTTPPTKTGYLFAGWYKEASGTNVFDFGLETITAAITLYAKWTAKSYTITFNSQNGSTVASVSVDYGKKMLAPTTPPTKTGHIFAGWFKEASGTNVFDFGIETITANITLYAKWIKGYTVTFNSNKGSVVPSKIVKIGEKITPPTAPTKTDSVFAGWYTDVACSKGQNFNFDKIITGNIILYAFWKIQPKNREELDSIMTNNISLRRIDVSLITNMDSLFIKKNFNDLNDNDITEWNVSSVTDMKAMFYEASAFNQNIGKWIVSKVTDMKAMFYQARAFNQNIGGWNVSKVTDMRAMFYEANAFNQNIGGWNVSKVKNMRAMFNNANAFNQDIGGWNVSKVTDMGYMFYVATYFNQDIGRWKVDSVTNMREMFYGASAFNQEIGGWKVDSVTNMRNMFFNASSFNGNISGWKVDRVTDMSSMFYGATVFNQDISGWKVGKVINMLNMFRGATVFNQNISAWNLLCTTTITDMFINSAMQNVPFNIAYYFTKRRIKCNEIYKVIFDSKGGNFSGKDTVVFVKKGKKITAPTTAPTKKDSALVGWYKDAAGTTVFDFETDTITADITLYAKWIKTHTVNFDSQNGSKVDSLTVKNGDKIKVPTAPTRAGYTFDGWYKDLADTTVFNFATKTITSDITLYAKWIKTYTVTFNSQGGSKVDSLIVNHGEKITAPTAPTKTESALVGWFKDAAGTTVFNFGTDTIIADITLYAKWKVKTYKVTFDSQGGSDVTAKNTTNGGTITAPTPPTRVGHTFDGWFKDAAGTTVFNFATDTITADITLYAKWKVKTYTVTFDSQGGSKVDSLIVKKGETITKPKPPTKTDSALVGWYKDAAGTTVFNFATDTITADITLYAKWKVKTYTVTFDSQGGSKVDSLIVKKGETITKPKPPTKTDSALVGWYKDATGTTVFNFATEKITGDITLYAKWIRAYKVTFNSQGGSKVDSLIAKKGDTITKPTPPPTKADSVFAGWYTDVACSKGNEFDFAKVITTDTTLYAFWKIQPADRGALVAIIKKNISLRRIDVSLIKDMNNLFNQKDFNNLNDNDITEWKVDSVTNMKKMFNETKNFNQPIGGWDVSSVTDMSWMFYTAKAFNEDIGKWDVSSVTNMRYMFYRAKVFDKYIGKWDVSNVTDMKSMFTDATAFNKDISKWDVSNVTDMYEMFYNATSFNDSLNNWDVSSVTNMNQMFREATAFNKPLNNWDVSSVTNMDQMFNGAISFNQDIGKWDVSKVTNMDQMFSGASSFNQPIGNWGDKVSNVTDMGSMFKGAKAFNQDIGGWKVDSVTDMSSMFYGATSFNQPIGKWEDRVSNVTNMSSMFKGATSFNQDIGRWKVDNVTNMSYMFQGATSFNKPLNNWEVKNVTNMGRMFERASSFNQNISGWNVSNVTNWTNIFDNCPIIPAYKPPKFR